MIALGVVFGIIGLVMLVLFLVWKRRIPFSAAVLSAVCNIFGAYKQVYAVSGVAILASFAWLLLWSFTTHLTLLWTSDNASLQYLLSVYLIFSFYWTTQVIRNTFHVTVSGLLATWVGQTTDAHTHTHTHAVHTHTNSLSHTHSHTHSNTHTHVHTTHAHIYTVFSLRQSGSHSSKSNPTCTQEGNNHLVWIHLLGLSLCECIAVVAHSLEVY